jgi:hypothetical protein
MKQIFSLMLLVSFFSFTAQAQTTGKVSGSVVDGSKKTIESATIALLRAKDSSKVKFAVAGKEGAFSFEGIADGRYLVSVTAVGHQPGYSPLFEITPEAPSVKLKTIELVPVTKSMGAVVVTARKPLIEQRIDRTIVNVDASITNAGTNALEVLEKSPGISVDKDGNISLKGKQGVVVLVDGRPTQLGAADLANMLRTMQSSGLDQIEIMTNPPAKYDAAGNAGVINIKTKKNKQMGYTGSVGVVASHGLHFRSNENTSLNYRHNKVNLFSNFSHNYRKQTQDLRIQRNFINPTTKAIVNRFEQVSDLHNENNSFNGKIGLDYSINAKTTLGAVVSGFSGPSEFEGNTITNNLKNGAINDITKSNSRNKEVFKNVSTNVNFRRVMDSTGREFTGDFDYVVYDGNTNLTLLSNYYNRSNSLLKADSLFGATPQNIKIYSGKFDYTHPLKNGSRFEAGVKSSMVRTDNNAMYDTAANGTIQRDRGRSNHFIYEENINAAYVNLTKTLSKKWNAQLGLRLEQTAATGNSKGYKFSSTNNDFVPFDTTFKNNYVQLFPTAYLQYKATENESFVLNYGRRIRRPNYESLNPFIEYIDRYTYQQGNPDLKPQFSHNIELSHTHNNFLTTTFNYSVTNNIIQQVIEQNTEKSEAYIKQANIASQRQYGISVNAGQQLTKWWTSNIYVNVFNNRFEGVVNNVPINVDATTLMLNGSQNFKLGATSSAEINGWFRTTGIEGVMKIRSIGMFSLGFSQQVMKGKGTLRFTLRDVLSSQHFKGESKYGDVDATFQNYNDSRAVSVGFTYRFSKGKVANNQRKRASSAADEQGRVGGGNN